jgi:putative transposase
MEFYHVLNRGVEKRDIFMDNHDYWRFVHNLFEFNDTKAAHNSGYFFGNNNKQSIDLRNQYNDRKRERLVDIHGWCLMKNHYHLLLSERVDGGLTKFMRKLNVGYANYFNKRYSRSGSLFQGRTKKKLIDSDAYFIYILHYIHLNPLDFLVGAKDWRGREIKSSKEALGFLEKYRWSSYLDYCDKDNIPSILTKDLFKDVHGDVSKATAEYLKGIEMETLQSYTLE